MRFPWLVFLQGLGLLLLSDLPCLLWACVRLEWARRYQPSDAARACVERDR